MDRYKLDTLVAETSDDNLESLGLLCSQGYKKTEESRDVPINGVYVKVFKYVKNLKDNS